MKTIETLKKILSTQNNFWMWYGFTVIGVVTVCSLLYYFPEQQFVVILLLSFLIIIDAFLISSFHLGKDDNDLRIWSIIYFVVGLAGVVWGILIWMEMVPLIKVLWIAPISFTPIVLTFQIMKMISAKRNKV